MVTVGSRSLGTSRDASAGGIGRRKARSVCGIAESTEVVADPPRALAALGCRNVISVFDAV